MNQLFFYGYSGRDGVLLLVSEIKDFWQNALREDLHLFRQRSEERAATEPFALSYPFGFCSREVDHLLAEEDIPLTFTIEERNNLLRVGQPVYLRLMGPLNVIKEYSGEFLARMLLS